MLIVIANSINSLFPSHKLALYWQTNNGSTLMIRGWGGLKSPSIEVLKSVKVLESKAC